MIDNEILINKPFSIAGKMRNAIGMTMSKDKLSRILIKDEMINGAICSSNEIPGMTKSKAFSGDCFAKVRGNEDLNGIGNTAVKFFCPKDCASKGEAKVFGIGKFSDVSSICRAALF